MKTLSLLTMTMLLLVASSAQFVAQEGDQPEETPAPAAEALELFGVIKKIDGPVEEVIIETPDGDFPEAAVDLKLPAESVIMTGQVEMVVAIEGTQDGRAIQNSMISVRHTSEIKLDKMLVEPDSQNVVTRMKIKTGEVRAKITDDRPDYQTDFKVATPNATASVRGTDVQKIGYSACFGTSIAVASGSISAARGNGTTVGVGAGNDVGDNNLNALESAVFKGEVAIPLGSVAFEVSAGQLVGGGVVRPGSDSNNASTNPTGNTSGLTSDTFRDSQFEDGSPIPAKIGRNRR